MDRDIVEPPAKKRKEYAGKMNFDQDCCDFAVTPAMLCEAKHATTAYNRE